MEFFVGVNTPVLVLKILNQPLNESSKNYNISNRSQLSQRKLIRFY